MPLVEVETASLRVRVDSPSLVRLSSRPAEDHDSLWIKVHAGLWISPPSLRLPSFPPEPARCLECAR